MNKKQQQKMDESSTAVTRFVNSPPFSQQKPRLFIDGTLGGGGHTNYLLQSLHPHDIAIGCDGR